MGSKVKSGCSWLAKKLTPDFHQKKCFEDKGLKGKVNEKITKWFDFGFQGFWCSLLSLILYPFRITIWVVMYFYDSMFSWVETAIVCSRSRIEDSDGGGGLATGQGFTFFRYAVYWGLYIMSFWLMTHFQFSMPYVWALVGSTAIFFAADWLICYPVMLFHSSFEARNQGRYVTVTMDSPFPDSPDSASKPELDLGDTVPG